MSISTIPLLSSSTMNTHPPHGTTCDSTSQRIQSIMRSIKNIGTPHPPSATFQEDHLLKNKRKKSEGRLSLEQLEERKIIEEDVVRMIGVAEEMKPSSVIPYNKGKGLCKRTLLKTQDGIPFIGLTLYTLGSDQKIGKGASKVVKYAISLRDGQTCAIAAFARSSKDIEYIKGEIKNIKHLKGCPHVVQIVDAIQTQEKIYLIMEYYNGGNLYSAMEPGGCLLYSDHNLRRMVALECAQGLKELFDRGIIHRDVKPENIFLDIREDGIHPKIGDFDVSCQQNDKKPIKGLVGTRLFSSPETIHAWNAKNGNHIMTKENDIWGLGTTLYPLFGKTPMRFWCQGDNLNSVLEYICSMSQAQIDMKIEAEIVSDMQLLFKGILKTSPKERSSIEEIIERLGGPARKVQKNTNANCCSVA